MTRVRAFGRGMATRLASGIPIFPSSIFAHRALAHAHVFESNMLLAGFVSGARAYRMATGGLRMMRGIRIVICFMLGRSIEVVFFCLLVVFGCIREYSAKF
jgi:hypothetical protein